MRKTIILTALALLVSGLAMEALAWEFKLKGEGEVRYRYWSRMGQNDIFGRVDADNANLGVNHLVTYRTGGTQNGISGSFGVQAGEDNFGPDMSFMDSRLTFFPKINVNKAISIEASINMTSLGIWSDGGQLVPDGMTNRGYANTLYAPVGDLNSGVSVPNTYLTLQWYKFSIKTPALNFSLGVRPSHWGLGLYKHGYTRASTAFSVSAQSGPLKVGFVPYFARRNSEWRLRTAAGGGINEGSRSPYRKDRMRDYLRAAEFKIEYKQGPLDVQLASDAYVQDGSPGVIARGAAITRKDVADNNTPDNDIRYRIHASYQYFNGRFFSNGEADWFNRWRSDTNSSLDPRVVVNNDCDAWVYGWEVGFVTGPSKMTLNYIRATGDDPTTRETTEDAAIGDAGVSNGYMKNWGLLMYQLYGTGTNWDVDGYGQPSNFHHVGARLDYAVAANLNLWGLWSRAWRDVPGAYQLGGDYRLGASIWNNENLRLAKAGGLDRPVPETANDVGWEVDLGMDWQILENLVWNARGAYWQPGSWWSHAYPNTAALYRLNPGVAVPTNRVEALIDVGRAIDPLVAFQSSLLIQF